MANTNILQNKHRECSKFHGSSERKNIYAPHKARERKLRKNIMDKLRKGVNFYLKTKEKKHTNGYNAENGHKP